MTNPERPSDDPKPSDALPAGTSSGDVPDWIPDSIRGPKEMDSFHADPADSAKAPEPKAPVELTPEQESIKEKIVEVLCDIYDPEVPVNIHALGMIYDVDVQNLPEAVVTMTLTSPACPVAGTLPGEVETRVQMVDGVELARVNLVWEPPWSPDLMSEAAKLQLNMF